MNTIITSKGDIMEACLLIAAEQGLSAISIRSVAHKADVSVGSVYNYFPNKSVLLSATVRKIWADIFYRTGQFGEFDSIAAYIQWLFVSIKEKGDRYRDFFLCQGSGFAVGGREISRQTVDRCLARMERSLSRVLRKDQKVKENAFDETFTQKDLARFIFTSLLTMLARGERDCSLLILVVERVLY